MFWRARLEGVSHEDAVARAGVSVTAGRTWVAEAGGIIPGDLDGGCGRYLSLAEREEIALGRVAGLSIRAIATWLGRAPSTISREPWRNRTIRQTGRGRVRGSGIGLCWRRLRLSSGRGVPNRASWPAMRCCVPGCRLG